MTPDLNDVEWPVRSRRLSIRPVTSADSDATWQFRRLESVTRWMTSGASDPEEYTATFVNPERLAKTLIIERDGVVIGDLMLSIEDAWSQTEVTDWARAVQTELGWCLNPEDEGRGYATEAVGELIRVCFEDLGLRRVTANCFADNAASWRLMERARVRRELHSVRESLHRSGQWLDGLGYALLADKWRERAQDGSTGERR